MLNATKQQTYKVLETCFIDVLRVHIAIIYVCCLVPPNKVSAVPA